VGLLPSRRESSKKLFRKNGPCFGACGLSRNVCSSPGCGRPAAGDRLPWTPLPRANAYAPGNSCFRRLGGRPQPGLAAYIAAEAASAKARAILAEKFLEDSRLDGSSPQWGFHNRYHLQRSDRSIVFAPISGGSGPIDGEDLAGNEVWARWRSTSPRLRRHQELPFLSLACARTPAEGVLDLFSPGPASIMPGATQFTAISGASALPLLE